MKIILRLALAIILSVGITNVALADEITVMDDVGREVQVMHPVSRVVTFNTYNTEFFRAIGGQDVLVGMAADTNGLTNYWPGLGDEVIAGQNQREPNYEAIVGRNPDLVIFPRNGAWENAVEKLEAFGIPVVVITGWDVNKFTDNVNMIGALVGKEERAKTLNEYHARYTNLISERLEGVEPRTIYFEKKVDFTTSVPGSGWHDMLTQAGGRNIFDDIDIATQSQSKGNKHQLDIDPEAILLRNPDIVIKQIGTDFVPPSQEDMAAAISAMAARPGWSEMSAVQNDQVFVMSYFIAGGMSKLIGKLYIVKWLYPELFEDMDPDQVAQEWIEVYQGVEYPGPHVYIRS
ncbi:MAG: ABC transporter substrate-binding protein [Paracoccaceae bacterium]